MAILDSFVIGNTMYNATTYILHSVECSQYIYCRKTFGEHFDIQIAIDNESNLKLILFLVFFLLNLFEYIVLYVYIIHLTCPQSERNR